MLILRYDLINFYLNFIIFKYIIVLAITIILAK